MDCSRSIGSTRRFARVLRPGFRRPRFSFPFARQTRALVFVPPRPRRRRRRSDETPSKSRRALTSIARESSTGRRDGTARLDGMEPNPPVVADRLRALNSIARARSALRDAKEALRRDVGVVVGGVGNEALEDDDDRNLGTRRSAARAEESNLRRARRETKRAREEALRRGMKNARKARGEEENAAKTSTAVTREILGEVARGIADESRIREFERCASERGGAKAYEEMRRVVDEERRRISEACEEIISSCEGMKEGLPRDVEDVERVVGRCREALDAWSFERARVVEEYVRAGMAEEMRRESDALARRIDDVRSLVDSVIDGRLDL